MTTPEKIDTNALPIKVDFAGKTRRNDWDCYEWRVTISGEKGSFWVLPYYCGLGHTTKPKHSWAEPRPVKPSNDDILHSLILDSSAADMNFSDWCSEYGYRDDSISALNTYRECLKTATMLRKHFGRDVIQKLREQLQDH